MCFNARSGMLVKREGAEVFVMRRRILSSGKLILSIHIIQPEPLPLSGQLL